MSLNLHRMKLIGKILYFFRKFAYHFAVLAGIGSDTMFERSIDLPPSGLTACSTLTTN